MTPHADHRRPPRRTSHHTPDCTHSFLPPILAAGLFICAAVSLPGCQSTPRALFPPVDPPVTWPGPPYSPRIRYVGSLRSAADVTGARPFSSIASLLVGEKPQEELYGPRAVVSIPEQGHVWVADPGGRCLHLFDLRQRRYAKILRMGDTPLLSPVGLSRGPSGSIFVCDAEQGAIYRCSDRDGALLDEWHRPDLIQRPVALHYDEAENELYVVDSAAHDIKVLGMDGALRRILGRRGSAPGEFNFPVAITKSDGVLWVVDAGNQRVQMLYPDGESMGAFGKAGDSPGNLALPKGVAVDRDGHIYVVDARFENVQVFDKTGNLLLFFGEEGAGPGEFWLPSGIAIDDNNRIWVCDTYNRRIQVFEYLPEEQGKGP